MHLRIAAGKEYSADTDMPQTLSSACLLFPSVAFRSRLAFYLEVVDSSLVACSLELLELVVSVVVDSEVVVSLDVEELVVVELISTS